MRNLRSPGTEDDHQQGAPDRRHEPTLGETFAFEEDSLDAPAVFPVVADSESFFYLDRLRVVIRELLLGIRARRGFLLLTGDVGLGKTTISRHIMRILEAENTAFALVFNTLLDGNELLHAINHDFGIRERGADVQESLLLLNGFLLEQYEAGRNCVIVVDDAQNLPDTALELIRMLSNLETNREKLVQILLVGQPELQERLDRPELRQLRSRVSVNTILEPLSRDETRRYVEFRLLSAPDRIGTTVTEAARYAVYRLTGGVPRRINILMDRCLRLADQRRTDVIDDVIVHDSAAALGIVFPGRAARLLRLLGTGRRSRTVVAAAAGLSVVLLVLGLVAFDRTPDGATRSEAIAMTPSARADAEMGSGGDPALATSAAAQDPADPGREALVKFLEGHGLAQETDRMLEAIRANTLAQLDPVFERDHGLRIVVLDGVNPAFQPVDQPIHTHPGDGPPRLIALWQPDWWLDDLRSGSRSDAIRQLQEQLIRTGHYRASRADGIAGPMTVRALRDFQQAAGIEVSGRPDLLTLFLLQGY